MGRKKQNKAYRYFDVNKENMTSKCLLCKKTLNTIHGSNLAKHIKHIHKKEYAKIEELNNEDYSNRNTSSSSDDDSQPTETSVSAYFENESPGVARCIVCKHSIPRRLTYMRKHLKEKHSKLIESQQNEDDDEEQTCYTEIVYLDDELNKTTEKTPEQVRKTENFTKPIRYTTDIHKKPEVKRRRKSASPGEYNEEVENFGKYITSLLKKLPKELCTQLQMDIVNLIMTAKLNKMKTNTNASYNSSIIVTLPKLNDSEVADEKNSLDSV